MLGEQTIKVKGGGVGGNDYIKEDISMVNLTGAA